MSESHPLNPDADVLHEPWYEGAMSDMAADAHRIALRARDKGDLSKIILATYVERDGIAKYILGARKRIHRGQGWILRFNLGQIPIGHTPKPDPTEPDIVLREDGALFTFNPGTVGAHSEAVLTRALVPSPEDPIDDPLNNATQQIVTHRILEDCYSSLKAFELELTSRL